MAVPDEEWLALGRAFEEAQRRSRTRARQLADHLINVDAPAARENLSGTYLEGRTTGWEAYTRDLGVPDDIDDARLQAWVQEAAVKSTDMMERLIATVENRDEVTRVFIDNYANVATNNTLWEGIDESGVDVARLAEAQYKTWVRSWSRKQQRDWHSWNEGISIPIEDKFRLMGGPNSGALVDGPRDWQAVNDPREHINCGHALRFTTVKESDLALSDVPSATVYNPPEPGELRSLALDVPPPTQLAKFDSILQEIDEALKDDPEAIRLLQAYIDRLQAEFTRQVIDFDPSLTDEERQQNKDRIEREYEQARQALKDAQGSTARAVHKVLKRNRQQQGVVVGVSSQQDSGHGRLLGNVYTFDNQGRQTRSGVSAQDLLTDRIDAARAWIQDHVSSRSIASTTLSFWETYGDREFNTSGRIGLKLPLMTPTATGYRPRGGTNEGVIIHEIAHSLESENPDVYRATVQWRERRTAGESPRLLSEITGIRAYDSTETSKPDNFFDAYIGKSYDWSADANNDQTASEVLTMGMQEMYSDPVKFAERDRDHFNLIVAIMTGTLEDSPYFVSRR